MANLRATSEVKAFLPKVAAQVTETLGMDLAKLIAKSSC